MPSWWLFASFAKLVGIVMLSAGLIGAVAPGRTATRLPAALHLGTFGAVITWFGGYAIMKATERSLREGFIVEALFASLIALAASWIAATSAKPRIIWLFLPITGLLVSMGVMVTRDLPSAPDTWLVRGVLPVTLGAIGATWLSGRHTRREHDQNMVLARTKTWWRWLARFEGTSLLILLGFVTPAKLFLGWHLDPYGLVGWAHGCLVLLFVASLWPMRVWHDWSLVRLGLAFIASLLPLGTFLFEHRFLKD